MTYVALAPRLPTAADLAVHRFAAEIADRRRAQASQLNRKQRRARAFPKNRRTGR